MGAAYQDLEKHAEAIEALKKGIALKPDDAGAYLLMGASYYGLKLYPEALAAYQQCLRLQPTGWEADEARDGIRRVGGR
jgi:tetratricopeptide (TPR) repeat protein